MPINRKHKLLFIHIPKNGGTSIEKFFNMMNKDSFYGTNSITESGILYSPQHLIPNLIEKYLGKDIYNTYFKFSFVRNPYDRVKSEFFWRQRIGDINIDTDFKKWVFNFYSKIDNDHKLPQYKYIFNDNGDKVVDFLGRVENMNIDFTKLLDTINYPKKEPLLKENINKNKKNVIIDQETKEKIIDIYNEDFKLLGYDK